MSEEVIVQVGHRKVVIVGHVDRGKQSLLEALRHLHRTMEAITIVEEPPKSQAVYEIRPLVDHPAMLVEKKDRRRGQRRFNKRNSY